MKSGICNLEFPNALLFRRQTIFIHGIEVRGDLEFQRRTEVALTLLRPLHQFQIISKNLAIVRQGRRSGMKAWTKRPMFIVGKPTWSHSALWYAGAIAHDAYHSKLYDDAKMRGGEQTTDADAWTGAEAEKKCLAFQRQILAELNADETMLNYVDRCAENPGYQGRNRGWGSWLDYLKRRW
jgi:hypothetical protein